MIYTEISSVMELSRGVALTHLRSPLVQDDDHAHRISVTVLRDGAAVDLTGATVTGSFVRADGVTVEMTGGTVTGNVASIELPSSCYREEGRCVMAVRATQGETISTIFLADGAVMAARTGTTVAEEETVLSLEELFRRLEAGVTSVEASAELAAQAAEDARVALGAADTIRRAETATANVEAALERLEGIDATALVGEIDALRADTTATVLLSDASWASGTIDVPGISQWRVLQVSTSAGPVLAFNGGTFVQGIGIAASTSVHRTIAVRFNRNGDTCEWTTVHYINHTGGADHGERYTNITITGIVGLIKMGG